MVRREAERYGVAIHHTELIGLIPQDALTEAAVWYLQLDQFDKQQVLEARLSSVPAPDSEEAMPSFLDELASSMPTPGGGSAAAYAAAMGAALVSMVAGLTIGKKKYSEVEAEMQAIRVQAGTIRAEMEQTVEDDAAAFEAVMGAFKLPKASEEEQKARTAAIQIATLNAAHIPLHTAENAVKVMELALRSAQAGNLNAISDAASGLAMARAALTSAAYNVRINLNSLPEPAAGDGYLRELKDLESRASGMEQSLVKTMRERGGVQAG
jgi:glutamate formiminotransferase/formiminotetrahydrofolate cyclodeaminase